MLIAVRVFLTLKKERDASPIRFASAVILIPSQEATSDSASKVTVLVASVLTVLSSPPLTKIPVPWEKILTGPWLSSITSLTPEGTWRSSGVPPTVKQFGLLGSLVGRLGSLCGKL